jgi:hypothetical protein
VKKESENIKSQLYSLWGSAMDVAQLYTENRKVCQEEPPNLCDAEIITVT